MDRSKPLPTLSDLIDLRINLAMTGFNCVSIGTIQAFDPQTLTVIISINYKKLVKDAALAENNIDSVDKIEDYPLLVSCPVMFLRGGAARLTFPIAAGDPCLILFCDREIDTWFRTGVTTTPQSERIHSLTDAIAIPGISSLADIYKTSISEWDALVTYSLNDLVSLNGKIYKSLSNSNTGNNPETDAVKWAIPATGFNTLIASLVDKTGERLSQAGDVKATARTTAPSGWLLCYGQAISRTTYDILFTAIGTTYGAGDGSSTFNLPDLRGRTIVGLDNMGGSQADRLTTPYTPNRNTLGGGVGEETHSHGPGSYYLPDNVYSNGSQNTAEHLTCANPNVLLDKPTTTMSIAGTSEVKDKVQPGLMLNYIIKI